MAKTRELYEFQVTLPGGGVRSLSAHLFAYEVENARDEALRRCRGTRVTVIPPATRSARTTTRQTTT